MPMKAYWCGAPPSRADVVAHQLTFGVGGKTITGALVVSKTA